MMMATDRVTFRTLSVSHFSAMHEQGMGYTRYLQLDSFIRSLADAGGGGFMVADGDPTDAIPWVKYVVYYANACGTAAC